MRHSRSQIELSNKSAVNIAYRIMQADDKWAARNSKADLAYMASIWAPSCDEEALTMMGDWNHWVRPIINPSYESTKKVLT